jgi:hypothetical protein
MFTWRYPSCRQAQPELHFNCSRKMAVYGSEEALRRQIELYFSESYLCSNAFLREIAGDSGERFVPLAVLLACSAVKALASGEEELAAAIAASDALQLSDDRTAVRRRQQEQQEQQEQQGSAEMADDFDYCALSGECRRSACYAAWRRCIGWLTAAVVWLSAYPLHEQSIIDRVRIPAAGAISVFAGTTRDNFEGGRSNTMALLSFVLLKSVRLFHSGEHRQASHVARV